jgi:hypothetical protein
MRSSIDTASDADQVLVIVAAAAVTLDPALGVLCPCPLRGQ